MNATVNDACIGCGLCAGTCPAGCITVKEGSVAG